MNEENFVFMKNEDGKITCGGYEIDSSLLQNNIPAITETTRGGGRLDTLAVPAGLFLLQQHAKSNTKPFIVSQDTPTVVGDSLYDKLLDLMATDTKAKRRKSSTRRRRKKKKRSTRRRR